LDERKPRKRGGTRSCYNKSGAPKAAFATKKLAERAIPPTTRGLRPYPCEKHGCISVIIDREARQAA
jgi:hypothetical protein